MKIYLNCFKRERGIMLSRDIENYSIVPRGKVIASEEEFKKIRENSDESLYEQWYSCGKELDDFTIQEFEEFKEQLTIGELKKIYQEYPYLIQNNKNEIHHNDGFATGMLVGQILD